MRFATLPLAAAVIALPAQVSAAPLCATLKSVLPTAQKDKFMAALKTGVAGRPGEWIAAHQIDGFRCVITTGETPGKVRGFYNCTWAGTRENQPGGATVAAIGRCFGVVPRIEEKSYTTTTLFDLQPAPRIWIALNEFKTGNMSFSLIAE